MKKLIIPGLLFLLLSFGSALAGEDIQKCSQQEPVTPESLKVVLNEADGLIKKEQFDQALQLLEKKSKKYNNHLLFFLRGLASYRMNKNDEAEKFFNRAVEIYPCFGPAWQNLAVIYYAKGKKERAAELMEKAQALIKPENPELLYQAAVFWLESSQPPKAVPLLERLAGKKNPEGKWLLALAKAYSGQGQPEKAAEAFIKAHDCLKTRPNDLLYHAALCYLEADLPGQALPLLQKLIKGRQVETPWLLACVNTLNQLKKYDEAALIMEKACKLNAADREDNLYKAARMWLEAGQPEKAIVLLEKLAAGQNPSIPWLMTLIQTYMDLNKLDQAEISLNKLLALEPDREELWNLAVWLALEKKQYTRAVAALEVIHRLKTPEAGQLRQLGDLYVKIGVPTKAVEAYSRAFGPNPTVEELDLLARTYLAAHQLNQAAKIAAQAIELSPTTARWALLGDINLLRRDLAQALTAYKKAAEMNDPGGLLNLKVAKIALRLEKIEAAEKSFRLVLDRAGQNSPAGLEASQGLLTIANLKQE